MTIEKMLTADVRDLSVLGTNLGATISNDFARTGTYSFKLTGNGNYMTVGLPSRVDHYVRCGLYFVTVADEYQLRFLEGSTVHIIVAFDMATGTIFVYRGITANLLGQTAGGVLGTGGWYCVEVYGKVADSPDGIVTIRVNGVQVLNLTSKDTRNAGSGVCDGVRWINANASVSRTWYVDDILIRDDAFPSTGGVYVKAMTGDGTHTDWTASAGNKWDCVEEIPPDMAQYIYTDPTVAAAIYTGTAEDFAGSWGAMSAVAVIAKCCLDASGAGKVRAVIETGGTHGNGADTGLSGTTPVWAEVFATADPADSGAWTVAKVNAIEPGVESRT